jgi:hypothetical protein
MLIVIVEQDSRKLGATFAEAPAEEPAKASVAKAPSKTRKRVASRYTVILACIIVYMHAYCIAQYIAPLLTMRCGSWLCRMTDDTTVGRTTLSSEEAKEANVAMLDSRA